MRARELPLALALALQLAFALALVLQSVKRSALWPPGDQSHTPASPVTARTDSVIGEE